MVAITLSLLLGTTVQGPAEASGQVVLVIERTSDGIVYLCNGRPLDETRVLTEVEADLRHDRPAVTPVFVLFDDALSLDKLFETGSLLVGKAGLRNVRYFAFSRKTGVMMELSPSWDRWKLSFDGKFEKKPW